MGFFFLFSLSSFRAFLGFNFNNKGGGQYKGASPQRFVLERGLMKYTLIKISNLIQQNISTNVHLSPVKTLCLLVYATLSTRSANVSLWAARLSSIKQQLYHNCKYVIWRFWQIAYLIRTTHTKLCRYGYYPRFKEGYLCAWTGLIYEASKFWR